MNRHFLPNHLVSRAGAISKAKHLIFLPQLYGGALHVGVGVDLIFLEWTAPKQALSCFYVFGGRVFPISVKLYISLMSADVQ